MFRFVALFALVAVAAAEPQYGWPYAGVYDATHMKTPSGDTVSVQAAKVQHAQLKAAEYAKKGYVAPVYAAQQVVYKAPAAVYNAPVAAAIPAVYSHGIQSAGVYGYPTAHHLFKREAEADSDSLMYTTGYTTPYINSAYNGYAGVYRAPVATYANAGYTAYTPSVYSNVYSTGYGYPTAHHLGKRDADSQVYQYSTGYPYANTYAGINYANTYAHGLNSVVYKAPVSAATYGYTTPYSTYGNIWNGVHY